MLPNFLLSTYTDEIIGDHQCEIQHNRSNAYHVSCTWQILMKKWEYNGTMPQQFMNFKKSYDSVRREVS
jgi:hypothetical protein